MNTQKPKKKTMKMIFRIMDKAANIDGILGCIWRKQVKYNPESGNPYPRGAFFCAMERPRRQALAMAFFSSARGGCVADSGLH